MQTPDPAPTTFLGLTKAGDDEFSGFRFAPSLEAAREPDSNSETFNQEAIADRTSIVSDDDSKDNQLPRLLIKFADSAFSFHPLIAVGPAVKRMMTRGYIRQELANIASSENTPMFEDDNEVVFELDEPTAALMTQKLDRFWMIDKGMGTLPSATILAMVATFDSVFAEIIKSFLQMNPARFEGDSFKVSVADAIRAGSIEKMIEQIIEDEVFELMRGSHHEQTEFVRDKLGVDVSSSWARYADFIEIFERRNLVAHGEPKFNQRYLDKCNRHGTVERLGKLGEPVSLGTGYLRHAADIILEYGILLIFSLWKKHSKKTESELYDWVNTIALKAISRKRYKAASRILEYTLAIKSKSFDDKSRKMQRVNLANAYYRAEDPKKAEAVLAEEDWSAVSEDFLICISAIKNDIDDVVSRMQSVSDRGLLSSEDFREWPAFENIKRDERFAEEYKRLFGKSIIPHHLLTSSNISDLEKVGNPEPLTPV
jgi:hypothetical protein